MKRLSILFLVFCLQFSYSQQLSQEQEVSDLNEKLIMQEQQLESLKMLLILAEKELLLSNSQIANLKKQVDSLKTNSGELEKALIDEYERYEKNMQTHITSLNSQLTKQRNQVKELWSLLETQSIFIEELDSQLAVITKKNKNIKIGLYVGIPTSALLGFSLGYLVSLAK